MTFYCPIRQEMLNLVTNCCKLLKVNQAAERAVSSTVYEQTWFAAFEAGKSVNFLTVQIQIRLLLEKQSDQGLHCLLFHLHLFDKIP